MDSAPDLEAKQMKSKETKRMKTALQVSLDDPCSNIGHLDQQFGELIEVVWSCERQWTLESRIEAAIRYGRRASA